MPMLPSEETLLIIANVVRKAQLQSQPGINPSSGSEQSQVVVTAGPWGKPAVGSNVG